MASDGLGDGVGSGVAEKEVLSWLLVVDFRWDLLRVCFGRRLGFGSVGVSVTGGGESHDLSEVNVIVVIVLSSPSPSLTTVTHSVCVSVIVRVDEPVDSSGSGSSGFGSSGSGGISGSGSSTSGFFGPCSSSSGFLGPGVGLIGSGSGSGDSDFSGGGLVILALGNVMRVLGVGLLSSVDDGFGSEGGSGSAAFPGHSKLILGWRVSTSKTPQSKPASCAVSRSSSNHQTFCLPNKGHPTSLQYRCILSMLGSDAPCGSPLCGQPVSAIHTGFWPAFS